MKKILGLLAPPLLLAVLWGSARATGPLPALGPLLDPANGIWSVASAAELPRESRARIPGLGANVRVVYDDRGVPHIFATSSNDAYRAMGYVVARDRLMQLELQTRAAAGTLSELAGIRALPLDREMREIGLPDAAERKFAELDPESDAGKAIFAFSDGVNAWIDGMSGRDVPVELHLLGRRPSRWEPINTIHLLNRMGYTLAYTRDEFARTQAVARVGAEAAEALFPLHSPIQEPIQPEPRDSPRFALRKLPPPGTPDDAAAALVRIASALMPGAQRPEGVTSGDAVGSNNWAVAPERAAGGHALLAGDPHLELTLPSIWYEAHIVVADTLDVHGVTIPGAPMIIVGFNREVAWTVTNTGADVTDFYVETVDDQEQPTQYRLDDAWVPLRVREERYSGTAGESDVVDTLRFTHRGPMRRVQGEWISMRWTVLEESGEAAVLLAVQRARSAPELLELFSPFAAPAQNIVAADRAGNIGIMSTGRFPIRPGDGRGDKLHEGRFSSSDWADNWSVSRYPQAINPSQGFVASANQQPIDPITDSGYLGSDWYPPWRALRINELLRADSAVTPDAMRRFQTDPQSPRAGLLMPFFTAAARGAEADSPAARAGALIEQWDLRYTKENERAVLFELAMTETARRLWDEFTEPLAHLPGPGPTPNEAITLELMNDPTSAWWDIRATAQVEQRDDILRASLAAALERAERELGSADGGGWRWDRNRHANIAHLLRLGGFGVSAIPLQGGPGLLNPSTRGGGFGSSWRMVVELGPELRAWGVYPGGQSGNPASTRYSDRIDAWSEGRLDTLFVPRTEAEIPSGRIRSVLILEPVAK